MMEPMVLSAGGAGAVSAMSWPMGVASDGMTKSWKCRLAWHSWVRRHDTQDPSARVCRRCGKQSYVGGGKTPWGGF